MARIKSKAGRPSVLDELRRRASDKLFKIEDYCFPKQLAFIQDPARFKTAVCSRRCLAKGTLVQTIMGPKNIEDIEEGDYVYDENGKEVKVKQVFYNGKKEVYKFTHEGGPIIEATLDHVVLTTHDGMRGFKERKLADLYDGTRIVRNEVAREGGIAVPYAYSIGAILGDECSRQNGKSIIYISSENFNIPEKIGKELGSDKINKNSGNNFTYCIRPSYFPEEYVEWCKGRYAHEKTCDVSRIMSWDRNSRLAFVAGLLDTSGSVSVLSDKIQISVQMQAKPVIEALYLLFLDLWQCAPSKIIDNKSKCRSGPVYEVRIKSNYFGKKILKELSPFLVTDSKKWKPEYELKLENDFRPDCIGVKRGASRIEDTYDIHVESKTNLYMLANGLITHNSGKSVACAVDLLNTALTQVGDVCYITLNRRSAKRIIWRTLMQLDKEFKLNIKFDNVELTCTLPNGNVLYIVGAKDEGSIENFRGMALRKVYIDEAQSFRPYIEQLIDDILEPCLTDYDGSLILIGTPGPLPVGYFYKCSTSKGWSNHSWTMHDNPHILLKSGKTAEQIIEERCERRGISKDDPSILREYYGRWVKDADSLVLKFDKSKNTYLDAPPEDLIYVFGIDIGWKDSDSISVLGYSEFSREVYLVEEDIADKQDITGLVEKVKKLEAKYKPVKMVMDAGALGKKIQEEIRQRHGIAVHAAEKSRKLEFLELLNDDLRNGLFKSYSGSRFEEDSYLVQWDHSIPGKSRISTSYHSDALDSTLYAWRECRHFLYKASEPKPIPGTDTYMDALEAQEAEKLERKMQEAREAAQDGEIWSDLPSFFDDE